MVSNIVLTYLWNQKKEANVPLKFISLYKFCDHRHILKWITSTIPPLLLRGYQPPIVAPQAPLEKLGRECDQVHHPFCHLFGGHRSESCSRESKFYAVPGGTRSLLRFALGCRGGSQYGPCQSGTWGPKLPRCCLCLGMARHWPQNRRPSLESE